MNTDKPLEISLLLIRVSVAAFFLVWSIGKIVAPSISQSVAQSFYSSSISNTFSLLAGILQSLIVLLFLAGVLKTWTYGALLGMHSASILVSVNKLFDPYSPPNYLFWAAIPTLAALITLFLLRKRDHLLTLGHRHLVEETIRS